MSNKNGDKMITIPMLTEKDMRIFAGKKVVLYSQSSSGIPLLKIFSRFGIEVLCACVENPFRFQRTKDLVRGLKNIKPEELPNYVKKHNNVIIQSVGVEPKRILQAKNVAEQLDLEFSPFTSGEIASAFSYMIYIDKLKKPLVPLCEKIWNSYSLVGIIDTNWKKFRQESVEELIVVCSPPKTADFSLMDTFERLNACVEQHENARELKYINLWHRPKAIRHLNRKKNIKKKKVIVGLREPVSQNLSTLYQRFSSGSFPKGFWFLCMKLEEHNKKASLINRYQSLFQEHAGDVQYIWNAYMEVYVKAKKTLDAERNYPEFNTEFLQRFVLTLQNEIVDVLAYPFNQEKGYTIIKEGDTEFFVYQLEKLNSLVPELSEWIGIPFEELESSNQASDKWIGESYKQAQKEIEITQEYFDKCFDEPYVKHCYSEDDIEKFKAKWRPHVKK